MDNKSLNDLKRSLSNELDILFENRYFQGYEDGKANAEESDSIESYNEGYEEGFKQCWDMARKLVLASGDGGLTVHQIFELFGSTCYEVFKNADLEEVRDKLREVPKDGKQRIQVGDEVKSHSNALYVVTKVKDNGDCLCIQSDGDVASVYYKDSELTKTGRHFPEICHALQQMRVKESKED